MQIAKKKQILRAMTLKASTISTSDKEQKINKSFKITFNFNVLSAKLSSIAVI